MNTQQLTSILGRKFWLSETEVPWLYNKAKDADKLIVEIGAAYGGSAVLWLLGKRPGVRVVSVDAFLKDSHTHFQASALECLTAVCQAVGETLYQDWTLIEAHSVKAVENWTAPIDVLFLDGDHEYEGARRDFELWAPHVNPGGAIVLHDSRRLSGADPRVFARGWQGPTCVVAEVVASGHYEIADECYSMTELRHTQ